MMLPSSILVPIDYSRYSEHALDYAVSLARSLKAKVHVLHVIWMPSWGRDELGLQISAPVLEAVVRRNQDALERLVDARAAGDVIGRLMVRRGDPRDLIVEACNEVQADLIVMGTHGQRGRCRPVLGSVAETIVCLAPCPVLMTHARAEA